MSKNKKSPDVHIRRGVRLHIGLDRSHSDILMKAVDGLRPSEGHVCFGQNGKSYELFYRLNAKTPELCKAWIDEPIDEKTGARSGAVMVINTGSDAIRETIKRCTGKSPSAIGITLKKSPDAERFAAPDIDAPAKISVATPHVVKKQKAVRKSAAAARVEGAAKTKAALSAKPKPQKAKGEKRVSALDEAERILTRHKDGMKAGDLMEKILAAGNWSTSGKTPEATLYAAMLRAPGRFRKAKGGTFTLVAAKD